MIGFIKKLFGSKPDEVATPVADTKVEAANSAPYKVPEPAATTPIPLVAEVAAPAKKPAAKSKATKKPAAKPKTSRKPKTK